jgi:transposase
MAEEAPKKRPVGRPSKYKPEFCERVLEMAAEGCSWAEYAAEFGIDRTTLYDWAASHEEFSTALTRAKALEQAWWEREARLGVRSKEFNANLWGKSVAARFRDDYTERKVTEVTGADGGAIKTETVARIDTKALDAEQREALKAALMAVADDK